MKNEDNSIRRSYSQEYYFNEEVNKALALLYNRADEIAAANIRRTEYELSVERKKMSSTFKKRAKQATYKIWKEKVEKIASDHLDFLKWDAIPFEWDTYYQAECTPQETAIALMQQAQELMLHHLAIYANMTKVK